LKGVAEHESSWGHPVWSPDGQGVVAVAWPHQALNFPGTARKLGILHCYNRPCGLHYIPYQAPPAAAFEDPEDTNGSSSGLAGDAQATASGKEAPQAAAEPAVAIVSLTKGLLSALSPVFTPDGTRLLFLSQDAAATSGVHAATSALYSLAWGEQVRKARRVVWPAAALAASCPAALVYHR